MYLGVCLGFLDGGGRAADRLARRQAVPCELDDCHTILSLFFLFRTSPSDRMYTSRLKCLMRAETNTS